MSDIDQTNAAVKTLIERALDLQPAIDNAISDAISTLVDLTLLLQEEEALRDAAAALQGRTRQLTSASHLSGARWKRSERAHRSLRELENLSRTASDHVRNLGRTSRREEPRTPTAPPSVMLVRLARSVRRPDGRIKVQDLAEEMLRLMPERYSSSRSAYAAIYDQLRRSREFERTGPGEFTFVTDRERGVPARPVRSRIQPEIESSATITPEGALIFDDPSFDGYTSVQRGHTRSFE